MSNFSKILVSVSLLGKRIFFSVAGANDLYEMAAVRSGNLEFKKLSLSRALNKSTLNFETGSNVCFRDRVKTFNLLGDNDLKTLDE